MAIKKTIKLTDESKMPYGKHKGKAMANVPAYHLLWLYNNGKCNGAVKEYIIDNMEVLKQQNNGGASGRNNEFSFM